MRPSISSSSVWQTPQASTSKSTSPAPGAGFDVETNVVTLIDADGRTALPIQSKLSVAHAILDRVVAIRGRRDG